MAKLTLGVCASGDGAAVAMQQVLLECETETGGSSAWFIAICSQCVSVRGVAHSLARECITAQAETGMHPTLANPKATNEPRIFRIFIAN